MYTIILAYYWTKSCSHEFQLSAINSLALKTLTSKTSGHLFLSSQRKVPAIKMSNSYLCLLLLVTSADINPNPGPQASTSSIDSTDSMGNSTYYPCGTCNRHVTWEDKAVCCEDCYCWYHIDCHNIHSDTYENLKASSASWICEKCGQVNYSQRAFQSSIWGFGDLTTNRYDTLNDDFHSTVNTDSSFSHLGLPMYTSSPNKTTKPKQQYKPKKKTTIRVI